MNTRPSREPPVYSYLEEDLRELQVKTLALIIGTLVFIASLAMVHTPASPIDLDREKLLGGLLLLLSWTTWRLLPRNYPAAVWLLVSGLAGIILRIHAWHPASNASALLALPSILALASLGTKAGIISGLAVSLLLPWEVGKGFAVMADGNILVALGTIWGTIGLVWAVLRPLRTIMTWLRLNYQRAQQLLEQARERQVELHQIRKDLEDMNRQLVRLNLVATTNQQIAEEARRAKEQFVANVSHELRTPLNMIIGFSEMITQSPRVYRQGLPRELLADVAAIQRNAEHLSRLVNDVLDLSKVEGGYVTLAMEHCSLQSLIEDAVQAIKALFNSKGLYLHIDVADDLPEVVCDPTRIRQVLLNLLSNAGRVTERGGVRVSAKQQQDELVIGVSDTGPGITKEDKERLFQPFRQLELPFQERNAGAGLGLSISKDFVELHRGRMWLESELGVGTTFYFSLPLLLPTKPNSDVARWVNPYSHYETRTRPRRASLPEVLPQLVFVDTEASLSPIAAHYLEAFEVVMVSDVNEAISAIKQSPAQALVLNDATPRETGLWQEMLAALPFNIPVITCQALGVRSATKRLGVLKCLVKPVTRDALLQAVESVPRPIRTILVVDDEPEALQLFTRMLTSSNRNYRLLRASDGQQALNLLRVHHPDLLLLDLIMPGMDGFQVLTTLHQDPEVANTPVITISAQDPIAGPISSDNLTVTRPGGLSGRDVLDAVRALAQILGPTWRTADSRPVETPAD